MLLACMFLFKNILESQNLIQNGSFENSSNINCGGGGVENNSMFPVPHVVDNWYTYNSPDYFNSICSSGGYSVPYSWFGNSYAKSGVAFAGIGVYDIRNNYKEYIYQQLTTPLQAGINYCMDFYVSRADRFPFAIKSIGAYISSSLPSMVSSEYINVIPQVLNQDEFITDTVSWVQIQTCFTAVGGEKYVTIGNFNNNAGTDTLRIESTNPLTGTGTDVSYYYIDNVSLVEQTTVGLKDLTVSYNFSVFPNPNNGAMQMDYDLGTDNNAIMNLFDVTGKLIRSYKLDGNKGSLQLNEQSLHNGIYFYHITIEGKTIKTDKIVIIK